MSIVIERAVPEDAEGIAEIYSYYVENTAVSFEYVPPEGAQMLRRMETIGHDFPFLAARENGRVTGYAYAHRLGERKAFDHSAELSIYIDKDCRRNGVGRALYTETENILRRQGVTNAYACIAFADSYPDPYLTRDSIEFHERMGYRKNGVFTRCGYKFGRWYGLVWMEKFLSDHGTPAELVRFDELQGTGNRE